jgi:predicted dehydrogenase
MIKIGVIGYGYWGPNIVRNFNSLADVKVTCVCDINLQATQAINKIYPDITITTDYKDITESSEIDIVAVVTPVSTHYELAKMALDNGKHVFVEKPFTATTYQAQDLIETAETKNLTIMVDHTFLFTGAVRKIKEIIDKNELGDILYYDSTRVNLGLFQHDINVIWDLAPHDFSIMHYVLREKPYSVSASGQSHVSEHENIAYVTVNFESNLIAHFSVNWLSPVKIRNTLIGGEKKMLLWDDISPDEKIKVYDKGVDITNREGIYELLVSYRTGDMWIPRVDPIEALKLESEYFIECISENKKPINDGIAGLNVVRMLEACNKSLKNGGEPVKL